MKMSKEVSKRACGHEQHVLDKYDQDIHHAGTDCVLDKHDRDTPHTMDISIWNGAMVSYNEKCPNKRKKPDLYMVIKVSIKSNLMTCFWITLKEKVLTKKKRGRDEVVN